MHRYKVNFFEKCCSTRIQIIHITEQHSRKKSQRNGSKNYKTNNRLMIITRFPSISTPSTSQIKEFAVGSFFGMFLSYGCKNCKVSFRQFHKRPDHEGYTRELILNLLVEHRPREPRNYNGIFSERTFLQPRVVDCRPKRVNERFHPVWGITFLPFLTELIQLMSNLKSWTLFLPVSLQAHQNKSLHFSHISFSVYNAAYFQIYCRKSRILKHFTD